jgi:hypothetical protein
MFPLAREAGDSCLMVEYRLVLPDGSTYSVAWPTSNGATFYTTETAEERADLRGADLLRMD